MLSRSLFRQAIKGTESVLDKFNETEYRKIRIQWNKRIINFDIFDVSPCNRKNAEMLELKNMDIIKYMKKTKLDFVILGIGYIDYHKMLKSFNRANIIKNKNIDSVHINLKKVNGQYISIIQQCLLLNIPHFCLGRDRLTEMASIGSAIFSNPKEVFSLLYYFTVNSVSHKMPNSSVNSGTPHKEDIIEDANLSKLAPSFHKALIIENALYLTYNMHAKLLQILKSDFYVPPSEMEMQGNIDKENKQKKNSHMIKKIHSFFNETTHDQIKVLRKKLRESELYSNFDISDEKKNLHVLIICDTVCVDYFSQFVQKNFSSWFNISPFYKELINLEKKSSYKYSLSLFLFVMAPFAWILTLLIKYIYYLWIEYFTKGKVITVGGDIFFKDSKLINLNEDINSTDDEVHFEQKLRNKKNNFEKVSLLGGLLQWFKDKSRN